MSFFRCVNEWEYAIPAAVAAVEEECRAMPARHPVNGSLCELDCARDLGAENPVAFMRRPALGFIFVTLFLDVLGIGLIVPILPKLVEQFTGGTVAAAAGAVTWLGLLYALMQFVFAPILGNLSDRYGRRPVILGSLLGSGVDYLLMAWAPNLVWLFVGRTVSGIMGANFTAATAYIADISPPDKRAANFGIIGAAFGLGFIAGPALGGYLGSLSLRLPFLVAAALTLINLAYGWFVLPESLAPENRRAWNWARSNPMGALIALRRFPAVVTLASALFLTNLAQFMLQSIWALYTEYRFQWTPRQVGASLAFVGLMAAVVQGGLARKVVPRLGERRSILLGFLLGSASFAGYGLAPAGSWMYLMIVIGCLGGIAQPAVQSLVSRQVPANEQGAVQGALTSLGSVAGIAAPVFGAGLFAKSISPSMSPPFPGAPFILGSIFICTALWLCQRSLEKSVQR